jgi:putative transposase
MDRELVRRRHLPHWDVPGAAYFVTACLKGSIPAEGLLDIARNRADLQKRSRPETKSEKDWQLECWKRNFVCIDQWLDFSAANRVLEQRLLAQTVVDAMRYFADERYDLFAYVVMPSHYHWIFQPRDEWIKNFDDDDRSPRERIMYSLNRFTSNRCNEALDRTGTFWQNESYDHWIRDVDELDRIIRYVEENPVKAGLVKSPDDWPFSSAWLRKALGLKWGLPLPGAKIGSAGNIRARK